jgi:hypothetical protein
MVLAIKALASVIPAREGGGSRLRSLYKSGKSVKMHTWCFLASPYGAYIFGHATGIGSPQLEVMLQLLCSMSFLMDKAVALEDCAPILQGVARALSLVEIHLPSCELDMKLHQLLHLAERIQHLGPSYTTAMWGYESLWHHLVQLMKNKQFPEATCMRSWIQMESAILAAEHVADRCVFYEPPRDVGSEGTLTFQQKAYWTVTNTQAPSIDFTSRPAGAGFKQARRQTLDDGRLIEIHVMYLRHSDDYSRLFGIFTAWLWEQWTADATPGCYLLNLLSPLPLRTHSRKALLVQDSTGRVDFKNKVSDHSQLLCCRVRSG